MRVAFLHHRAFCILRFLCILLFPALFSPVKNSSVNARNYPR
jgi:hypothetical protein